MTKDEIKKALECCISYKDGMCKHCPNYDYKHEDCMDDVKRQALDLITEQEEHIKIQNQQLVDWEKNYTQSFERLKAQQREIDGLKTEIEQRKIDYDILYTRCTKRLKQAKIDVLNELREKYSKSCSEFYPALIEMTADDIDKMIEELKK